MSGDDYKTKDGKEVIPHNPTPPEFSSPLRIFRGPLDVLDEDQKHRLRIYESDFGFRILVDALALYEMSFYAQAEEILRFYVRAYPVNPHALNILGVCLFSQDKPIEAVHFLEMAWTLNQSDTSYVIDYTTCLIELGQQDKAGHVISQHLNSNPDAKCWIWFSLRDYGFPKSVIREIFREVRKPRFKVLNNEMLSEQFNAK